MSCKCDIWRYPQALEIPAGLQHIPRQLVGFSQLRKAMLSASRSPSYSALARWEAREQEDLGLMLIEMGAYVFDMLNFYDEVIANECYLRSAQRRPSVRKLVELIGYRPRPAVGAQALLALLASGRQPVTIPADTAFRSGAFDDEPPQVFEIDSAQIIHPLSNQWEVVAPRRPTLGRRPQSSLFPSLILETNGVTVTEGDIVVIRHRTNDFPPQTRIVSSIHSVIKADRNRYQEITFNNPLKLAWFTKVDELELLCPTNTADLWTTPDENSQQAVIRTLPAVKSIDIGEVLQLQTEPYYEEVFPKQSTLTKLLVEGQYKQLVQGDPVVISKSGRYRVSTILEVKLIQYKISDETPFKLPITRIRLRSDLNSLECIQSGAIDAAVENWTDKDAAQLTVHLDCKKAGTITVEADTHLLPPFGTPLTQPINTMESQVPIKQWFIDEEISTNSEISQDDSIILKLASAVDRLSPEVNPTLFAVKDRNERGIHSSGTLNPVNETIKLDMGFPLKHSMEFPMTAYGNIVSATRGETVISETMGSGDATIRNQSFKLKKKPLTYLPKPTANNESGVASTLEVYVDSILWAEVSSFFNVSKDTRVYCVYQDDEENSYVVFGDGNRGSRLPTGRNNVIANYRYGAGAAAPPAGSITQITRPIKDLTSVLQPVAAGGGADAESADTMQQHAPNSSLLLGRAVSAKDMEAVTMHFPGVRMANAGWNWDGVRQRPVVNIFFISDSDLSEKILTEKIHKRLEAITDPSTPISVKQAKSIDSTLALVLVLDNRYLEADVEQKVLQVLLQDKTGLLVAEKLGIGKPLYRSQIFSVLVDIPGVMAVHSIKLSGQSFDAYARTPGTGRYFDFKEGSVQISWRRESHA